MADAHHALDVCDGVGLRSTPSRATTAIWIGTNVPRCCPRPTLMPLQAELPLVRGVRDHHEVVLAGVEAADARPLVEHADDRVALGADAHHLADRVGAGRLEQRLVRRLAEHDDVLRCWTSVPLKKRPEVSRAAMPAAKFSVVPNDDHRPRPQVAIEDALLRRRGQARMPSWTSTTWIVCACCFDGPGVGNRQVRPLQQLGELDAVGEAQRCRRAGS